MSEHLRIALVGNPNCGKTCIFNALTGTRQHVGNYPGVTVESKSGSFSLPGMEIELIDLPGVYALSAGSPEEAVVCNELTRPGIDLIINVIDSTIPQRSLYLTTQLAELHIPIMLAFNMSDEARKKGIQYDLPRLETYFGAPIVETVGSHPAGVVRLRERLTRMLPERERHGTPMFSYGKDIDDAIGIVASAVKSLQISRHSHIPPRFFAIKLLENDSCATSIPEFASLADTVAAQIRHLWQKHAIAAETFMADRRYAMLAGACRESIRLSRERRRDISDRIDLIMTNKTIGLPIFLLIMYLTFTFTFTAAEPLMALIENAFAWLADSLKAAWPADAAPYLRNLLTDGVIAGVGGVLVFLPNILFLFLAIALLEDSGYMARAAFVMDGLMRRFGLQGRSFVPLVLGFGCNVPAIMATRCIESERDRKTTIMILPLMSCGARLPIYALIIPAFFADRWQGFMMWLIYTIGVAIALCAAFLMKATLFKGDGEVYLMELPPYRMPTLRSLLLHMWDRGKMYVHKAGTLILGTSIILYACNTFPEKTSFSQDFDQTIADLNHELALTPAQMHLLQNTQQLSPGEFTSASAQRILTPDSLEILKTHADAQTDELKAIIENQTTLHHERQKLEKNRLAEKLAFTFSGRIGHALEPLFRPIGFDWKLTTASLSALAAKEVFVSQLGILYAEGETDAESLPLRQHLARNYTPLQGFCIMLFSLLSIPCLATLAVIRRELNSWKMAAMEASALFALAYAMTFAVYQAGSLLRIGTAIGF